MNANDDLCAQGEQLLASAEFDALLRAETETLSSFVPTLGPEELRPMMIVLLDEKNAEGTRERALLPVQGMTEDADKQQTMLAMGTAVAETGVCMVGAFLISEAWSKTLTPAETWRMKAQPIRPSKTADRQETLVVWGRTVDRRVALAMAPIRRDETTTQLGEWTITPCQPAGGGDRDNLLSYFFRGFLTEWNRRANQ